MESYKKPNTTITILLSIFMISLALFTYQVALTRLYSAILSYHYVFLTTSVAILGLGIGSVWAYRERARVKGIFSADTVLQDKIMLLAHKCSFILSCGLIAVFALIFVQPFADSPMICIVLGIVPFVIAGYLYALLFKAWPQISGKLYFADLIGAGAGSIIIVALLNNMGMLKTVLLICLLPLAVTLILPTANKRLRAVKYAIAILLAVCLLMPMRYVNSIEANFYGAFGNAGKQYGDMKRAGLAPEIVFSRWNSFSRTDLIKVDTIPGEMYLIIDGGATAPMFEFDGNIHNLEKFKNDNGFIPFAVGDNEKTLLIGVGGGLDVLYALAAGSKDITAVEINTASIEAVKLFGDYNGNIFAKPEVRVYGEDGRGFVRNSDERYDLIFLSIVVTNTTQGVGFALSENYIYTVEAMEEYLALLNDIGRVAFVAHNQNTINKLIATAIQAMVNKGIPLKETPDYLALFFRLTGSGNDARVFDPVIMIKGSPFSKEESRLLENELSARNAWPAYLPNAYEQGNIAKIKSGEFTSIEEFIESYSMNVKPAIDDNPYFFNFDKKVNSGLVQILIISLIGSLLLFAPYAVKKKSLRPSLYFGLLGMGFMMIEIPLIQRFILYLGHPTLAFSYILAAMLIGCGLGGLFSSYRLFRKIIARLYFPPILAALVNIVLLLSLSYIFRQTLGLGLAAKVVVAALIAICAGFFMGMPFPRGLALLGESGRRDLIPLMWGINGTMSVVGSAVSIILSMAFGFNAALAAGALIYLVIGLFREV